MKVWCFPYIIMLSIVNSKGFIQQPFGPQGISPINFPSCLGSPGISGFGPTAPSFSLPGFPTSNCLVSSVPPARSCKLSSVAGQGVGTAVGGELGAKLGSVIGIILGNGLGVGLGELFGALAGAEIGGLTGQSVCLSGISCPIKQSCKFPSQPFPFFANPLNAKLPNLNTNIFPTTKEDINDPDLLVLAEIIDETVQPTENEGNIEVTIDDVKSCGSDCSIHDTDGPEFIGTEAYKTFFGDFVKDGVEGGRSSVLDITQTYSKGDDLNIVSYGPVKPRITH